MNKYLLVCLFGVGCATVPLPEVSEGMLGRVPDASLEMLVRGRGLVLEHCANCHAPPRPEATLAADWANVFEVMVKKSKVNAEDARLIEMYLRAGVYEH
jgi:hypothetical protein